MAKKLKLSKDAREKLKNEMLDFRIEAEEGNKPVFMRMTTNERFKIGKQWDHDDTSFNEARGKFSLTINEVLPIVLDIAGTEQENPLEYKVRNVKGGTQTVSEVLTSLTKNVMDKSMGREEAGRSFESGVSTARGYLQVSVDYTKDPLNGDLLMKEIDPFMVLPDPTCKEYDYNNEKNGAKYIIVDEWEDKEKLEARYSTKKEELKSASFDLIKPGRFGGIMNLLFGGGGANLHLKDDYRHHDEHTFPEDNQTNVSKQKHNYRVSTYWWKKWKKGVYVQRLDDPLNYLALTNSKDIRDAKRLAEGNENIRIIELDAEENPLTIPVLNKTIMVGDVFIETTEDPFDGMNLYPIVRFAPYFDHGYEYPPVENLIGPQKMINFTFSSLVNIVKGLANSGWKVVKGSQRAMEWLEDHGGEDGIVINESQYGGRVTKIEPNKYPTGYDVLTERGKQNMREISQVQLEVPAKRTESGRALAIREQQSVKTKGIIFRNWNQTNTLLATVIVELIRNTQVFSNEEIMAIIDEEDLIDEKILLEAEGIVLRQIQRQGGNIPPQPNQPNPIRARNAPPEQQAAMLDAFQDAVDIFARFNQQVRQAAVPIAIDIMLKMVRKMQSGRYGIKVDTSPMAPTMRMAKRLETLQLDSQLIEGGRQGISRKKLIEISDIPDKEEIMNEEVAAQPAA